MAYDWSRQPLATSPWRKQVVPHIPSILIKWAKAGRRITYTQLADELYTIYGHEPKARKTLYGPAVGAVGFAIRELGERWGEKIPPLNLIVVEAETDLPGEGADAVADYFFPDGGAGIALDRRTAIEAAIDAVHDYGRRWDRVAEALGAELLEPTFDDPARMERFELPVIPDAYMPESDEHKALKAWVSTHPGVFMDYGRFDRGAVEHKLSSGDRLDAYFSNGVECLAVEVKASTASDAELIRGIYQCIKYRAVLRAEHIAQRKPALCDAVLVSPRRLSKQGRMLAKRLHVDFVLVPQDAEGVPAGAPHE